MAERFSANKTQAQQRRLSLEVLEDRRVLSSGLLTSLPLLEPTIAPTTSLIAPVTPTSTTVSSTSTVSAQPAVSQPTTTTDSAPTSSATGLLGTVGTQLNVGLNLGLDLGISSPALASSASTPSSSSLGLDVQASLSLGLGTAPSSTTTSTSTPTSGLSLSIGASVGLGTTSSATATPTGIDLGLAVDLGTPSTTSTASQGSSGSTSGLTLDLGIPSLLDVSVGLGTTSTATDGATSISTPPLDSGTTGLGLSLGTSTGSVLSVAATTSPMVSVGGEVSVATPAISPVLPVQVAPAGQTVLGTTVGPVDSPILPTGSGVFVLPSNSSAGSAPLVALSGGSSAANENSSVNGLTTTAVPVEDSTILPASPETQFDGVATGISQAALVASQSLSLSLPAAASRIALSGGAAAPEGVGAVKAVAPANPGGDEETTDETAPPEARLDGAGSGLVTEFQPMTPFALDQAFNGLVEQLDLLGSEVAQTMRRNPWATWGLGCVAAAVVCEALHRQRRRRQGVTGDLALDDDSTSIHWLPGLSDPSGK